MKKQNKNPLTRAEKVVSSFFYLCSSVNFKRTNIYELGAVEWVIWSGQILTGRTGTGRNPFRNVISGRNTYRKVTSDRNPFWKVTTRSKSFLEGHKSSKYFFAIGQNYLWKAVSGRNHFWNWSKWLKQSHLVLKCNH